MSLFAPPMNMSCQIITTTRNRFGDWVYDVGSSVACHFRENTITRRGAQMEINDADAMVWFPAGTDVEVGSVLLFEGKYYEVIEHVNARRLSDDTVQFIKCDLKRTGLVS